MNLYQCPNCEHQNPESSKYCNQCATPLFTELRDELRVITLMFADIKGFTSLSEKLAPDEVKEILDEIFSRLTKIILDEAGQVIKYEGDLIMAAFGLEVSDHRGPHHASYAALKMQTELISFSQNLEKKLDLRLQMRIGMHTGKVVVGLIGNRLDVLGDSVNLAARMEQHAPVGSILISSTMARLIQEEFDLNHLEPIMVKGKKDPIAVSEIMGRKSSLLDLKLVSRNQPGLEIQEFLRNSRPGFRTAIIYGNAGSGKTSFLRQINRQFNEQYETVRINLSKDWQRLHLLPKILLNKLIQRIHGESIEDFLRLHQGSTDMSDEIQVMLEVLLGMASPSAMDSKNFKMLDNQELLFDSLIKFLMELKLKSILLLVDDIQFIDDSSKVFLNYLSVNAPFDFILIASCTQQQLNPIKKVPDREIILDSFNVSECRELFQNISQISGEIPSELLSEIYQQSKGNPRYTVELIHFLIEKQVIKSKSGQIYWDRLALDLKQLPSSMELILQARYDQLESQFKLFLRYSACFNELVLYDVLSTLLGSSQCIDSYNQLQNLSLLDSCQHHNEFAGPGFVFKEKHFQKVIYDSMPVKEKSKIHQEIFWNLQQKFQTYEQLEIGRITRLKVLFYHCQRAHLKEDIQKLGLELSNLMWQKKQFESVIQICDHLMDLKEFEILQLKPIERFQFFKNYLESLNYKSEYVKLLSLAKSFKRSLRKKEHRFQIEMMTLVGQSRLANTKALRKIIQRLEAQLESLSVSRQQRMEWRVQLQLQKAAGYETEGDLQGASDICHRTLALLDKEDNQDLYYLCLKALSRIDIRRDLANDHKPDKRNLQALVQCEEYFEGSGQLPQLIEAMQSMFHYFSQLEMFENCIQVSEKIIRMSKKAGNPGAIANALANMGETYLSQPETQENALTYYLQSLEIWESLGEEIAAARCLNDIGVIYHRMNQQDEALVYMKRSLAIWKRQGLDTGIALFSSNIGTLLSTLNRLEEAKSYILESMNAYKNTQDKRNYLRVKLLYGNLQRKLGNLVQADRILGECLEESRSSVSLKNQVMVLLNTAFLRLDQNRTQEVNELIKEVKSIDVKDQDVPVLLEKLEKELARKIN